MTAEREHRDAAAEKDAARRGAAVEAAGPTPDAGLAGGPSLLGHPGLQGRGYAPVRASVLRQMQRSSGNQAVQRQVAAALAVQRDDGAAATAAPETAPAEQQTNAPPANPTENYVVPFDRAPLSLPGEEVLFNDVFKHADPTLFQLVYTGVGGKFDSAAGTAGKTVAGLNSGNLPFFVDAAWDGTSAVTVKLDVKRISDGVAVMTYNWTFGKKVNIPTTMVQQEAEAETNMPAVFSYKIGPDIGNDGTSDYVHETILETFGTQTCNITMADLKPAWKTANPAITSDAELTRHFFGGSGSNGTFTVDVNDKIYDQHGGGMPNKATFEAALTTMKEITSDLPQTYTSKPGTALGTYTIRRILKLDGTKKLKKFKT